MATKEQTVQLSEVLNQLTAFKNMELSNHLHRDVALLQETRESFAAVFDIVDDLQTLPTQHLPEQTIKQISDSFRRMVLCCRRFKRAIPIGYSMQGRGPTLSDIRDCANDVLTNTAIWIPFLAYKKGGIEESVKRISQAISLAEGLYNESMANLGRKSQQVENIIEKARETAANAGAGVFTDDFVKEAKRNRNNSFLWLFATGVFVLAAFCFSVWAYNDDYSQYKTPLLLWPKLTGKLILLSLCFTATMWCGKLYKSAKHLSLLNRHRALGLKTFQAFSSAAADPHTKDMVLLETTRSIFANSNTGLIAENGVGEIDSNIISIAGKALEQTHGA